MILGCPLCTCSNQQLKRCTWAERHANRWGVKPNALSSRTLCWVGFVFCTMREREREREEVIFTQRKKGERQGKRIPKQENTKFQFRECNQLYLYIYNPISGQLILCKSHIQVMEYYLLSNNTQYWYQAHMNEAEVILPWERNYK